ncbi:carboxymuconolactone decarboxylase family protein [Micromonospora sp. WMMA1363]|uniref:carboxymuconolactone decarboxylase family protein n=1 Tax=Micromonospora sp. WMMA1363 TaxID=3053985 RepID=UPI00259CAEB6|nr:carboxymuconolactone decarboxylase family protein [Micromonospora sp. WMMA1363]MDM4719352.1 carboxymuconolactone decarboxylase family protein [Micromonospora sp. WMMA1363]
MATLPDPTERLRGDDRAAYERMADARAHADGRATLGDVYVRMFNNPGVAVKVGALGEHLRFHATLPDDVRELVILRFARRCGLSYEWSHHQRPARLAGVSPTTIDRLASGEIPDDLPDATRAALEVVDAVVAARPVPGDVQDRFVAAHGTAGIVEVVALCGLYSLMGYMVTAFEIPLERG